MIDIILPCYRAIDTIEATINSIKNQTYKNWNLIIVVDGYDEKLLKKVKRIILGIECCVLLVNEVNQGVAYSRNRGVNAGDRKYVAFLDADDLWHPEKLKFQLEILENHSNIAVCATNYDRFKVNPNMVNGYSKIKNFKVIPQYYLRFYNPFCFSSLMIRRDITRGVKMDEVAHEDYDFIIKLCEKNDIGLCLIPDKLVGYRLLPNSLSGTIYNSAINSLRIRKKNYGLFSAIITFPIYVIAVLVKRYCQ